MGDAGLAVASVYAGERLVPLYTAEAIRRRVAVGADCVGFVLETGFIVGYGIGYAERYCHLPGIYLEGAA